jgi:hypothetical protein
VNPNPENFMIWPTLEMLDSMAYGSLDEAREAILAIPPNDPDRGLFLYSTELWSGWGYVRAANLERAKLIAALGGWNYNEWLFELDPAAPAEQLDLMEQCRVAALHETEYLSLLVHGASKIGVQHFGGEFVEIEDRVWTEVRGRFHRGDAVTVA